MTKYFADIGLEVHAELSTRSKMFCSCAVVDPTTANPNTSVCPVCCGMPGTLPVINRHAVELAIRTAIALQCKIAHTSIFARKNYFYPDLPKGYQISQYEYPLAVNGRLLIQTSEGKKYIRIHRAHLEEDTGKLTHVEKDGKTYSLVDLNRAGIPLLEIVSEPDMHTVEDVVAYSRELRLLLRTINVSSGDMEKGTMRFEANLSMRPEGCEKLGTRVEVKNLNSFKAMENAIIYQMQIQRALLEQGKKVAQQTLGWDETAGKTFLQRSKENANDYRYFPEPDLPPLIIDDDWIREVKASIPELPNAKRSRFAKDYKIKSDDIERLVEDQDMASFFEACIKAAPDISPLEIVNWMLTDLTAWLKQNRKSFGNLQLSPSDFTKLIALVNKGIINRNTGKEVLNEMLESGKSAAGIIKGNSLSQVSDSSLIHKMIEKVLSQNPVEVQLYVNGKDAILNWLFGQVMREAKGKANPQVVKKILQEQLDARK
ncbi:MAG: Asp-tRNA(Asn)/Glu-tRNA(Gln) amidotransferase subunit GatB [Anaerolineales bacterium]|nr:Asp-tRNA(Asn)/Glu-tRNA(Gln) amidotransferase subunit GatB [Anaerolineales bacterium]